MADSGAWKKLGSYLIGAVVCIGVPAFTTSIAPVSRVSFKRHGDSVSARAHILLFLVVPVRPRTIDPVMEIAERHVSAHLIPNRTGPPRRIDEQAFLVVRGRNEAIEIPVSPEKLEASTQRARDFLADPKADELQMTLVASWFVSAIGGVFSVLTAFYVIGVALAAGRFLRRVASPGEANGLED